MEQLQSTLRSKGWYAGVGSRETPADVCELMEQVSLASYAAGFALSSGDAQGADRAFYAGAVKSPHFKRLGCRIFLSANCVRGRYANPAEGFYNATLDPTWDIALQMATEARGSMHGLESWGIALHTRNVYQIHGQLLRYPVKALIYWAKPIGKGLLVKGGTNTAVALALKSNIPTFNLYKDTDRLKAETMVSRYLMEKVQCQN